MQFTSNVLPLVVTVSLGLTSPFTPKPQPVSKQTPPEPQVESPEVVCVGCSDNAQKAAEFFFDRGVTDKKALAVVLGNIKQESKFNPAVCEGTSVKSFTPYHACRSGGYGLIQFTSSHRFYGLGEYARSIGSLPSELDTQLNYIVTEREWKLASNTFKTAGLPIHRYDNAAYRWLGWGIKGARMSYAYDYLNRIVVI